jgi:hypothetical protein
MIDPNKIYNQGDELAAILQGIGFVADTIGVGEESWTPVPEFDVTKDGTLPIICDTHFNPAGWACGKDKDGRPVIVDGWMDGGYEYKATIRYTDGPKSSFGCPKVAQG